MTPKQAFEVLLNIPEPRRTLTLSDAATALRVSEFAWIDVDGLGLRWIGDVRTAGLRMGKVQTTKVKGLEGAGWVRGEFLRTAFTRHFVKVRDAVSL
jgi:hypothetical protein